MSYECPKCSKKLSSKQRLVSHLEKNLPCDLQCRICEFKGDNRHKFYRHMKKEHPVTKERKEIIDAPPLKITPMEDFKIVIDTSIGEVTIRPRNSDEKERLFRLLRLSPGALIQALKHLDGDYNDYLQHTLGALLSMVHVQPDNPELHSICLTDISRRSVSFYTRTQANDNDAKDCRWIVHPHEASMQVLRMISFHAFCIQALQHW
jgi:hypothetical protein